MIDEIIDQLLFQCSPEDVATYYNQLTKQQAKQITLSAIQSFNKKLKIKIRDLNIIESISYIFGNMIENEKQQNQLFKLSEKISVWIAIVKGYNKVNLSEKTKIYFYKNVNKSSKLWNVQRLQKFFSFISTKDQKFKQQHNQQIYENQLEHIEYIMKFFDENIRYIPANFDYRDILVKYVCINRMETKIQKDLLTTTLNRLFKLSNDGIFHSSFRYCFQFYRYGYDQKSSPYKPVFSIFQIIKKLPSQSLSVLIQNSFLGLIWTQQNYTTSIKSCINAGIIPNTLTLIQKIKADALKNNMVQSLITVLQTDVQKGFVYLKFQHHFNSSFELLQIFILGAPPRAKVYQKLLSKTKNVIFSIPEKFKERFLCFLQTVKSKYQQSCNVSQLNQILSPFLSKGVYKVLNKQQLKANIKKYDWASQTSINQNKQSDYKGLYNIGNSCYMNSFIQALYMTKQFRYEVLSIDIIQKQKQVQQKLKIKTKDSKQNTLIIRDRLLPLFELQKLFSLLYKSNRPCINPSFFKAILPVGFRNTFQQDTAQFGRIYLGILEQIMPLVFEGNGAISVQCLTCRHYRQHKDKFLDIILSCQQQQDTLPNLLKQVNHPEQLEGVQCQTCNKKTQKSIRQHNIKKLPNYSILTFNRFAYNVNLKKKVKLDFKIPLQQYIKLPYQNETRQNKNESYQLYSIIVHRGASSESGHYYTFAKQSFEQKSKWLCLNDSSVTQLENLSKVSQFLDGSPQDTPYVLFYQNTQNINKIKSDKLFTSPFLLSQKLRNIVQKQDLQYLKSLQKTPKFNLPKINFNFMDLFKKDEDQEDNSGPGNNRLIM